MNLIFSLFPLYLFGNLHCFSMCGPLALLMGKNPFRHHYFLGRIVSFAMAGLLAGAMGELVHGALSSVLQWVLSGWLIFFGLVTIAGWGAKVEAIAMGYLRPVTSTLSTLPLKNEGWPLFLFGFFSVAIPCGQTLIVFSACALEGDAYVGFFAGGALALFTTPALYFAAEARRFFSRFGRLERWIVGGCALWLGLRGIAPI